MLRNVISSFRLKRVRCLKLISWKYTFKRLNEEYDIAKRKKQALDKLYETGKISQSTRDSFDGEINAAIATIEKQQKELVDSMAGKTSELENQIKMLENLLANYEIQHVVGEIDEDIYQREISLLTTGLETTRNELNTIKQVATSLSSPAAPAIQAPAAPEPAAQIVEAEITQPIIAEPTPVEVPVEAVPIETAVEPAPIETAPAEIPIETVKAEAAPAESAPIPTAPVEPAPVETVEAPIEAAPVETAPIEAAPIVEAPVETTAVETPIIETAPVETPPAEINPPVETTPIVEVAPIETPIIEAAAVETTPVEEAPIVPAEPEVQIINEPTNEIAPQEPAVTETVLQEPIVNIEAAPAEPVAVVEQPVVEQPVEVVTEDVTPIEVAVEPTPEQPAIEVPLQDFEVTEPAQIETTLEKVMDPAIETISSVIVEEAIIPAHPSEAPHAAQTEMEANAEAAAETEDSSEKKSE